LSLSNEPTKIRKIQAKGQHLIRLILEKVSKSKSLRCSLGNKNRVKVMSFSIIDWFTKITLIASPSLKSALNYSLEKEFFSANLKQKNCNWVYVNTWSSASIHFPWNNPADNWRNERKERGWNSRTNWINPVKICRNWISKQNNRKATKSTKEPVFKSQGGTRIGTYGT
jgi:hypothetical protein